MRGPFDVTGQKSRVISTIFLYMHDRQNLGKQNSILVYIKHCEIYIA